MPYRDMIRCEVSATAFVTNERLPLAKEVRLLHHCKNTVSTRSASMRCDHRIPVDQHLAYGANSILRFQSQQRIQLHQQLVCVHPIADPTTKKPNFEIFGTCSSKKVTEHISDAPTRGSTMKSSETVIRVAALSTAFMAGAAASHIYHTRREPSPEPPSEYPGATLIAGVELGGTTCRAAVASLNDPATLSAVIEVPTRDPLSTMNKLVEFLRSLIPFASIGIASFGPLDLDPKSATYGYITTTGKSGWQNLNLLGFFAEFPVPIGLDTDVNAPALAELRYGGRKGDSCAYVTVGTGIGVGVVVNGQPIHGLVHPEGGHIMALRKQGDNYEGWCDIHKLSVESMASAKACADRAGVEMKDLASVSDDHAVWDDVAYYLAQLCISICYIVSPHVIILSGGVMQRSNLFEMVRKKFDELNEGYISHEKVANQLDEYIVPSIYGNDIGIIGAIELARRALDKDG